MDRGAHRGGVGAVVLIREPASDERLDLELPSGTILSLEQIRSIRSSNEYTEGPAAPRRPGPAAPPRTSAPTAKHERTHEVILVNNNNYEARCPGPRPPPPLSRSTSMGSSGSSGSGSSEQGLLVQSPPLRPHHQHHHRAERPVRTQPKALSSPTQPLLLKQLGSPAATVPPAPPTQLPLPAGGKGEAWPASPHQFICERCGKCKCSECTAPRALPARLVCDGQCLCSAESVLEHGTCMCLVKGLFYHCSNEDDAGDSCADQPCSVSRGRCVPRFLCMGLLTPLFPCLLCYPPAKACVRAARLCHDRLRRPGCRCKNSNTVYCKLQGWAGPQGLGQGKPS